MRRWMVLAAVLLALAGCGGDPAATPATTPSATPTSASPDAVFARTMDDSAPGWREDFSVGGVEGSDAEMVAVLSAKAACQKLESMPVEEVLLSFLAGQLPPDTVGSLVYAATVAYCPSYTEAVQAFADENR